MYLESQLPCVSAVLCWMVDVGRDYIIIIIIIIIIYILFMYYYSNIQSIVTHPQDYNIYV